ncbi:MAG: NitT/TauT family transport system ATP-binding protein [Thermoanaerobacteraceae bacterium]|jgi:NitT/TauT family transport system ATP-binding protein|uniref:ABC transporter ATP-binding protein n=1 Tax=Biomaibacter acetigenes TaxID=2316383 RepID=A0A3G2R7H4_9FIRM|nr:ABC transporter ATP-binding protein [Biomaibacter acetigenes]AYO31038.1 ABC transporter ATP-binding protein [Biomaibacter acetigenes]MDK2877333.1 NitT/TauT family transport system ATP-binding protein [Thermoanaerobacteraceae bacterium]MDN5301970.1 NitT/TauT family transport system ATP-binding protein [Thermoanaerobacteraceae bacterium]
MVKIENVSVVYSTKNARVKALENINLTLEDHKIYTMVGPSGSGKTTLIYTIAGLLKPTEGSVSIKGKKVEGPSRDTAVILQDFGLFPWKTVEQNIALGLIIRKENPDKLRVIVGDILDKLSLKPFAHHYPGQLSGGQKQRVAIGRALALSPSLLLMDEPFSSLDAFNRENMQHELLDLWRQNPMTILLVTHSIEEAVFLGQKIIILSPSPGKIMDIISNEGWGLRQSVRHYKTVNLVRNKMSRYVK